jgi:hypothetical protein
MSSRGKFIILSFPRFAGGKFISNCLSLSKHCCPQDRYTASQLLDQPDNYDFRLKQIMTTLPENKANMINWISKYEFGDQQLYGPAVSQWRSGTATSLDNLIDTAMNSGMHMFIVSHGGDIEVRNLLQAWPDSIIIKLINHVKFSEISKNIKSNDLKSLDDYAGNYCKKKYQELAGPDWPIWEQFESVGYDIHQLSSYPNIIKEISQFYNWTNINNHSILFDVDNSIFNKTEFLAALEKLYLDIGLDDFNPVLVEKFWQAYMSLHLDN